jgi:effector-binding domain-containing protein
MSEIEVRIDTLKPMRMISAYGFGTEPENIAWEKLNTFMDKNKLAKADEYPATFGFNNPNPCHGSPNYGYEIWLPVDDKVEPDDDLRLVDFSGGLYAVTTFTGLENIGDVWNKLVKWAEESKYQRAHHQWLEELTTGPNLPPEEFVFNIYLPIAE